MDNKRIVIYGGGTVYHVQPHLALAAPAYGSTAKNIAKLCQVLIPNMDVDLRLTKMAGGDKLETNEDISKDLDEVIADDRTKVVIMSAALCDFKGRVYLDTGYGADNTGKYGDRLHTRDFSNGTIELEVADKIIGKIRKQRKDIFLVGFKTTSRATPDEQYIKALDLCKRASCNLVFANDVFTRLNMVVTPEEARYQVSTIRLATLTELVNMIDHRTHLTFTRSTVVKGDPIKWDSDEIPDTLRKVVNYCIENNAYKPFNGVTAGHFAYKVNDNTFLTSIRKTNFNKLPQVGLVKIVTDGPDTVLAYGAKPSVGGQSQRIVFHDHPGLDCIVHFHCHKKDTSEVPTVSQKEFECGSHECGQNTSKGLKQFGNIHAVYLDNHGPNIVFNSKINPQEVIDFIEANFDLSTKTGGFVSIKSRLETPDTLETALDILES